MGSGTQPPQNSGRFKLAGELLPGTIGAELQEWEQQEVEA